MKTVFITGIGKGLGKELFEQLIEKKYAVIGLLRNKEDYKKLLLKKIPHVTLVLADISKDEVALAIAESFKGPVDLLINNAGISGRGVELKKIISSEVNDVFNVHCTGVLRVVQALLPNLLLSEDPVVINVSSRMGSISGQSLGTYKNLPVSYSYRIAKAAQNMLTASLRNEFRGKIKFISLHPGKMKTQKAQVDADLEPSQAAKRIISAWETGKLQTVNGILELPETILPW